MYETYEFNLEREFDDEQVSEAISVLERVRVNWLRRPGVTAVDVGLRIHGGQPTGELALRAHVARKRQVPEDEVIPESVGGFSTDVIEAVYEPHACREVLNSTDLHPEERVATLLGGVSVGGARTTAGTLGAIVWDRTDGSVCVLSNWHVLAGSRGARPGERIFQPGIHDGAKPSEIIGRLKRMRLDSAMDAAIAELDGMRHYCPMYLGRENITLCGTEAPRLGMVLQKTGRTTRTTGAVVDGLGLSLRLTFADGTSQLFHDQIHLASFGSDSAVSLGGDSGSVWVSRRNKAVGLHFAGEEGTSQSPSFALANRMDHLAEALDISFAPVFFREDPCQASLPRVPSQTMEHLLYLQRWLSLRRPQPVHDPIDGYPQPVHDPIEGQPQPVHDPIDGYPQPVHDPIDGLSDTGRGQKPCWTSLMEDAIRGALSRRSRRRTY